MADLVSMRKLSTLAGVTLRAIQLAIKSGRIQPVRTEQHGKTTRVFFDPDQAVADFKNSRDESRKSVATRGEKGKGPQPDYKTPGDKERDKIQAPAATPPGPVDPKKLNLFGMGDGAQVQAPAGNVPTPGSNPYHKHRADREEYNAKMAALDYKAKSKEFVPAGPVKVLLFDMGQRIQSNMLAIPGRVSAMVAAEKNEKKIYDLLTDEITQALESLANAQLEEIFE